MNHTPMLLWVVKRYLGIVYFILYLNCHNSESLPFAYVGEMTIYRYMYMYMYSNLLLGTFSECTNGKQVYSDLDVNMYFHYTQTGQWVYSEGV